MQKLDEDTRAARAAEYNAAVRQVCALNGISLHSGTDCAVCNGAGSSSNGIPCPRCRHIYAKGMLRCPFCHG
jgi:hypothetical protein